MKEPVQFIAHPQIAGEWTKAVEVKKVNTPETENEIEHPNFSEITDRFINVQMNCDPNGLLSVSQRVSPRLGMIGFRFLIALGIMASLLARRHEMRDVL